MIVLMILSPTPESALEKCKCAFLTVWIMWKPIDQEDLSWFL